LALAKLQRKLRLLESPYKTPQTLVGGNRLDGALVASSGRTATTRAMGKGSTQFQHLVHTEVPIKVLEGWLSYWADHYLSKNSLKVKLRPYAAGSETLNLCVLNNAGEKQANVIFATFHDHKGKNIMSVRDQNTLNPVFRQNQFMTLLHLYLIYRYKIDSVYYVTPTEDNRLQALGMEKLGIFSDVHTEVGEIIVAVVNQLKVKELLNPDEVELHNLISKQ